ncbi:MAG TPA: class I SAM-dependent methyltransferase [Acidimicrobiia bacterium]
MTDPDAGAAGAGINYQRLYEFRFQDVEQRARQAVWDEIAPWLHRVLGHPERVLDPAAGRGEFIRAVPAAERWAIDIVDHESEGWSPDIRRIVGDARHCELPDRYFDGILLSNFLEHFTSQEEIGAFLQGMARTLKPGGRIAVLGPNFRYCAREYFDCADHTIALTHVAVSEHLYAAGFEIERVIPRFLPFSFRSRTPRAPWLVRAYLGMPLAWRFVGRQFLLVGRAPAPPPGSGDDGAH